MEKSGEPLPLSGVPEARRVAVVFRVALGLVFVLAFGSLLPQLPGLIGPHGIAPAIDLLAAARDHLGGSAPMTLPTLFWWIAPDDAGLEALCVAGIVASVLFAVGIAPKPMIAFCWLAYLSFLSVGDVFLGYQWDALLLETAFFAFFLVPLWPVPAWRTRAEPPPRAAWWMLRVLLFKLMFLSGVVKIASHDPHWADLTALRFHYWTQPLPAWPAWYANRLPDLVLRAQVLVMLVIELIAPCLIFGSARPRRIAFALLVALQAGIAATGSYGFFNVLASVLALVALDDEALAWVTRWRKKRDTTASASEREAETEAESDGRARVVARKIDRVLAASALVVFLPLGVIEGMSPYLRGALPAPVASGLHGVRRFGTFNTYGLFAVMTTDRREISVEGSADGKTWREYRFRYKPGALDRAPAFVAPYQPRLDWQMWFAGLESCREDEWFLAFQMRLLQGRPEVLSLLDGNPFPDAPPRFVRTPSWQYRFSDGGRDWWTRTPDEEFCPPLTLENGRLSAASLPAP